MKIVKAYKWYRTDSISMAIYAAEQVIKIFEDRYPNDKSPHNAIKAAKAYLKDPNDKNKQAAIKTRNAAYAAARSKLRAKIGRFMKARIKKLKEL